MSTLHTHEPGHEHPHGHGPVPAGFNRAFVMGITLNVVFVAVEAFYGWKVSSLALLADAGHNLGDVAGLVLAWGGALAARRRADARHTYGWKRASILAAFFNAVLLMVVMGSLGWEAVDRLGTPQATEGWTVIAVAGMGILINAATALLFLRGRHDDLNIRGAFLHMAADALVSGGVVVGGALYLWQGWLWLDPVISLVIVGVIVLGTWSLFTQSLHLLFDGVPHGVDIARVRQCLLALPGVADVHDLHIWAMGTSQVALTAHLVTADHDGTNGATVLQAAQQALRTQFRIEHATLQLETPLYARTCHVRQHGGCA